MALTLLGVLAVLWVLMRIRTLLFMLFVSLFIAVALEPAVQFLAKRGWRRGVATGAVFLAALLVTVAFFGALVPVVATQAASLAESLPRYLENLESAVGRFGDVELIDARIRAQLNDLGDTLSQYGDDLVGTLFGLGTTVFGLVFQTATIALFSFYMVADGPKLRRTLLSVLRPRHQREALRIWEIAVEKTGGYVYSRLILAGVAAGFTATVLVVLGIPYPWALGLWVGALSQFVPVVGTYIAAVLPVLVALFQTPGDALWVAAALVAYQQLENFVIAPKIAQHTMAIHPAVSIGAVIAGGSLLGPVGVILALPVTATVQAFISTAIERHELIEDEALEEDPHRRRRDSADEGADKPPHPPQGLPPDADGESVKAVGSTRVDG